MGDYDYTISSGDFTISSGWLSWLIEISTWGSPWMEPAFKTYYCRSGHWGSSCNSWQFHAISIEHYMKT